MGWTTFFVEKKGDLGWLSTTTVILIRCSCSGFQSTIPILLRGIPDQHPKLPSVGWRSSVVYGIPLEIGEFSWNRRILMFLKGPLNGPTGWHVFWLLTYLFHMHTCNFHDSSVQSIQNLLFFSPPMRNWLSVFPGVCQVVSCSIDYSIILS